MTKAFIKAVDIPKWLTEKYFNGNDLISVDDLINAIEDLDAEVERTKEEFEDYKEYVESNYKELSYREQVE